MSGEIQITPGYTFDEAGGENIDLSKLNRLVTDLVARLQAGAVTNRELADGTITADKLDADVAAQLGLADGSVTTSKIVDNAVTNAKLADMDALTVLCRALNSAGDPGALQATSEETILLRRGNALIFGSLAASQIQAGYGVVTNVTGAKVYWGSEAMNLLAGLYWTAGRTVNFPAAFTSGTSYVVVAFVMDADGTSLPGATAYTAHGVRGASTGMTLFAHRTTNPADTVAVTVGWIAIGI